MTCTCHIDGPFGPHRDRNCPMHGDIPATGQWYLRIPAGGTMTQAVTSYAFTRPEACRAFPLVVGPFDSVESLKTVQQYGTMPRRRHA